MNKKLQPTVLAIALAASFGAQAATVYKIENIDEFYKVNGTVNNSRSGFGITLNNANDFVGGASGAFAPALSEGDQDIVNNSANDVVLSQAATYTQLHPFHRSRTVKRIPESTNLIFKFSNALEPEKIEIFDEVILDENISTIESFAFDISDSGLILGTTSSPSYAITDPDQRESNSDRNSPFYAYEFLQRAMIVDNGVVNTFEPDFSEYGGQSGLTAINDSNLVVGYMSTGLEHDAKTRIESSCLGNDARFEDISITEDPLDNEGNVIPKSPKPIQICALGFVDGNDTVLGAQYYLEAYSWQYQNGVLTNATPLGRLTNPIDDNDAASYVSVATDVNNSNIAVGRSTTFRKGDKRIGNRLEVATVYKNGKIIDLMDHNNDSWFDSSANSINNNNLVVGYMEKNIRGFYRKKFFIYDALSEDTTLSFPTDFSETQSDFASNAKSINDKNQVVGSIEVDSQKVDSGRRTHGFIYEHSDQSFNDINDLLTCESKGYVKTGNDWKKYQVEATGGNEQKISYDADITVVDASKIAEDGTIIATALVTLPRVKTRWVDDKGNEVTSTTEGAVEELVVDANGEPVFDTNATGEPVTEQIPRAVILKPTEGEACQVVEEDSLDYKQERQGAGFGLSALLIATAGLFLRRFRR